MFWKTAAPAVESDIDQLLNSPDVQLTDLMDSEFLLQEVKVSNKRLVSFLTKPEIIRELMDLSLKEPPGNATDKMKYKYSSMSCEVITADEDTLVNAMVDSDEVQQMMVGFLRNKDELNPLLGSFYARIYSVFVAKQPQKMLDRFMSTPDYLDCLLSHTSTPSIMNLLFFMITSVNNDEYRDKLKEYLCERNVIRRLIRLLSPTEGEESNTNAPFILCELIRQLRDSVYCREVGSLDHSPDPLLNQIQSEDAVKELLNVILTEHPTELSVIGGIQVILGLLQPFVPTVNLEPQTQIGSQSVDIVPSTPRWTPDPDRVAEGVIVDRLKDFHRLLLEPPHAEPIELSCGRVDVPLGQTRLFIVKLVSALLETGRLELHNKVIELGIMEEILRLFVLYERNSFLHSYCEQCISALLDGFPQEPNSTEPKKFSPLLEHVVRYCNLPEFILKGLQLFPQASDAVLNDKTPVIVRRIPYAGHLYKMANKIVMHRREVDKDGVVDKAIKDLSSDVAAVWERLENEVLTAYNLQNKPDIDSNKIDTNMTSLDKESADFPPLGSLQTNQAFYDYQMQPLMPIDRSEHFSAIDDHEFDKKLLPEDFLKASPKDLIKVDLSAVMNNLNSDVEEQFNLICNQNISSEFDFGSWPEAELKPTRTSAVQPQPRRKSSGSSSSDSSDEETIKVKEEKMELDSDAFTLTDDFAKDSENWANFDNFSTAPTGDPFMDTTTTSVPSPFGNELISKSPGSSTVIGDNSAPFKME